MVETCVPLLRSGCSEAQRAHQDSLKLPDFAGLQCACAGGLCGTVFLSVASGYLCSSSNGSLGVLRRLKELLFTRALLGF